MLVFLWIVKAFFITKTIYTSFLPLYDAYTPFKGRWITIHDPKFMGGSNFFPGRCSFSEFRGLFMFTRLQLVILYDISTNNFLFKKYQLKYFFLTNQHIFPSKSVIVYVENAFLSVLFNVSIGSAHGLNFKPCY